MMERAALNDDDAYDLAKILVATRLSCTSLVDEVQYAVPSPHCLTISVVLSLCLLCCAELPLLLFRLLIKRITITDAESF